MNLVFFSVDAVLTTTFRCLSESRDYTQCFFKKSLYIIIDAQDYELRNRKKCKSQKGIAHASMEKLIRIFKFEKGTYLPEYLDLH